MYAILGCGSKGAIIADKLKRNNKPFLIIDRDPQRIKNLREMGFDAYLGDITNLGFEHNFSQVEALVILSASLETTVFAIKEARKKTKTAYIITRAEDKAAEERLLAAGADRCINPNTVLGYKVVSELEQFEVKDRTQCLKDIILDSNSTGLAIIAHNNPDPDCLSSALALKIICDLFKARATIYYSGKIERQENKAFVNTLKSSLGMELVHLENQAEAIKCVNEHSKIVLVDSPAPGANNILPANLSPNIIIDHHSTSAEISADFVDIRNDMGATATMMTRYLQEFGIEIHSALAAALFYGISVDTKNFTRDISHSDLEAASFLSAIADTKLIEDFHSPPVPEETIEVIGKAIQNRKKFQHFLLSCLGIISGKDAIPQAAEYLLQMRDVSSVLCYGIIGDKVHLSARSKEITVNIGDILIDAFKDKGSVGGHPSAGGGYVELGILAATRDKERLLAIAEEVIESSFLAAAGVSREENEVEEKEPMNGSGIENDNSVANGNGNRE